MRHLNLVGKVMTAMIAMMATLVIGCGSDGTPESENYGNLLASPGGLVVLEEEHPTGWGRAECFLCHEIRNMHVENRTGLPDEQIDLPNIRAIVRNQGEASCVLCHGDNGVQP